MCASCSRYHSFFRDLREMREWIAEKSASAAEKLYDPADVPPSPRSVSLVKLTASTPLHGLTHILETHLTQVFGHGKSAAEFAAAQRVPL